MEKEDGRDGGTRGQPRKMTDVKRTSSMRKALSRVIRTRLAKRGTMGATTAWGESEKDSITLRKGTT